MTDENDWLQYKLLVMNTLKRIESKQDTLIEDVVNLKMKAGIIGFFCGLAPVAAKLLFEATK